MMKTTNSTHLCTIFIVSLLLIFQSCSTKEKKEENIWGTNWAWSYVDDLNEREWDERISLMKQTGVNGLLLLKRAGEEEMFEKIGEMAHAAGMNFQVWITVMNPKGADSLQAQHPEWYVVNRNGESCLDKPPYIAGYKWLCGSREPVQEYLINTVRNLAKADYVDGIHLDYIRFPDVILPRQLWEKYDIVQDKEYAEYDFCYCDVCRSKFEEKSGYDPLTLEDPSQDSAWVHYRYDVITNIVNRLYFEVKKSDKELTAAVFPSPSIAKKLVRQDWTNWHIDRLMPMMYHHYYLKDIDWIEEVTRQGVNKLDSSTSLYSGLFINEIDSGQMKDAVRHAKAGGAEGIVLFNMKGMKNFHWRELNEALRSGEQQTTTGGY